MKTVSIFGAAGGVGTALAHHLAQTRLYRIKALVAPWDNPARVAALKHVGVHVYIGDIRKSEDMKCFLRHSHIAVNCAAILPGKGSKKDQYDTNVHASEDILRSAKIYGVERVIFFSTAGVATHYDHKSDETAEYCKPSNTYVYSKIECEKMLDRVAREIHYPCIILRPVSIYGPSMTFRWPEIIHLIKKKKMALIDHGSAPYPLIHETDLSRAVVCAIERLGRIAHNEKFIVSSNEPTTIGSILCQIAEILGVSKPKSRPYRLVLFASYVLRAVPEFLKPEHVRFASPLAIKEYKLGHRYDTGKAERVLGFKAKISFNTAVRQMLAAHG